MKLIDGYTGGAKTMRQLPVKHVATAAVTRRSGEDNCEISKMANRWPRCCCICKMRGYATRTGGLIVTRQGCKRCRVYLCGAPKKCFDDFHHRN